MMIFSPSLMVLFPYLMATNEAHRDVVKSDHHTFPSCSIPTEIFHLPTINETAPLSFAYCRPKKSSRNTLGPSGSTLGLAPSENLSQTGATSIVKQLVDADIIKQPVFSLLLINSDQGVLSIGGTAANAVGHVLSDIRGNLDRLGGKDKVSVSLRFWIALNHLALSATLFKNQF